MLGLHEMQKELVVVVMCSPVMWHAKLFAIFLSLLRLYFCQTLCYLLLLGDYRFKITENKMNSNEEDVKVGKPAGRSKRIISLLSLDAGVCRPGLLLGGLRSTCTKSFQTEPQTYIISSIRFEYCA